MGGGLGYSISLTLLWYTLVYTAVVGWWLVVLELRTKWPPPILLNSFPCALFYLFVAACYGEKDMNVLPAVLSYLNALEEIREVL